MIDLFKQAFTKWREDEAIRSSAALSFYIVLALPALLLFLLSIGSFILSQQEIQHQISVYLNQFIGGDGRELLEQIITQANAYTDLTITTILSLLLLLITTSGMFTHVQHALNKMWQITPAPKKKIKYFVINRGGLFLLVVALGALFLVSILAQALFGLAATYLSQTFPAFPFSLAQIVSQLVMLIIFISVVATLYKFLPNAKVAWKSVFVGAAVTTFLFIIGKEAMDFYVSRTNVGSAYGAAGSLIVLLFWIYYSSLVFLYGAEITQVYAKKHDKKIRPDKHAKRTDTFWNRLFG